MPGPPAGWFVQQPPNDVADCRADDAAGENCQRVVGMTMLRCPAAAGEGPRIALDLRLAVHEGEDLLIGGQVVLLLDVLYGVTQNKGVYCGDERYYGGDLHAPIPPHPVKRR